MWLVGCRDTCEWLITSQPRHLIKTAVCSHYLCHECPQCDTNDSQFFLLYFDEQLEPFLWQVLLIWSLDLQAWSYVFMFVLCISALSLCCGNRRLPFTWNVSSFSWSLTFLLKCMAGDQWNKVSIFFFYSCSYLHGLECEYCGNKCLHPFNTSQQEGRVGIFQFSFISVINLNFNQLNEPFKSVIIIYNSFIQFMSSSLHLLKDPMHLSLFMWTQVSIFTMLA